MQNNARRIDDTTKTLTGHITRALLQPLGDRIKHLLWIADTVADNSRVLQLLAATIEFVANPTDNGRSAVFFE